MKRFKYLKNCTTSVREVQRKMPTTLKQYYTTYGNLDISDLNFLRWKHKKEKNRQGLDAVRYAMDSKSKDSEIAKQLIEGRYAGVGVVYNFFDGEAVINDY
jgi:hypothetical protein